jgi:DNA-binding GntR family transcriptional regulator
MPTIINSLERTVTVANALDKIRRKIIYQEYRNGDQLTEIALSREYGISRGSVRTALQELENEGVMVTLPTGRKRVMSLTEDYLRDLYTTRKMIECEAARQILARQRMDFGDMAIMVGRLKEVSDAPFDVMHRERISVNMRFHRALMRMCRNRPLWQCWSTLEPMIAAMSEFNSNVLQTERHGRNYVDSHRKILELFLAGDAAVIDYLAGHCCDTPFRETMEGMRKRGLM